MDFVDRDKVIRGKFLFKDRSKNSYWLLDGIIYKVTKTEVIEMQLVEVEE